MLVNIMIIVFLIKLNRKNCENESTYKNKNFYLKKKITKYSLLF